MPAQKTLGDGFGQLVAAELVNNVTPSTISLGSTIWTETVKDTEVTKIGLQDHTAYIVKVKGPVGNVGKSGEPIQKILVEDQSVKFVLAVDASLKLGGEETGSMAEGVGAAIRWSRR